MKSTKISENITQLTRFGLVNCYLVREDDGLTLVDTTVPGATEHILTVCARLGLPLRRILLTHAHGDHIGSLDSLHGRHPTLQVLISRRDARLLDKDKTLDRGEPQAKLKGSLPGAQTKPTRLLDHGDTVGSLLCVSTPGHTPGHMCFFDTRDHALLAGDAFVTVGGRIRVVTDCPLYFPFPGMATWHKPTALVSAGELTDGRLPALPRLIAPGHGATLPATRELLVDAVDRAGSRLG